LISNPILSVVIPAFRARDTIAAAVRSVGAGGLVAEAVEIVVASDDGGDYATVPGLAGCRFTPPGPVRSGCGAARNRALDAARGGFVTFLDADDTLEPGYLAATLRLARRHGLAFGETSVIEDGREILRLPGGRDLGFADLAETGASFRPVVARARAGHFLNRPSQDTLHTLELLAGAGGRAPVAPVACRLCLNPASVTRAQGFAESLDAVYADYIRQIGAGRTRIGLDFRGAAMAVFEAKRGLNRAFMAGGRGESYYGFVAHRLARRDRTAAE